MELKELGEQATNLTKRVAAAVKGQDPDYERVTTNEDGVDVEAESLVESATNEQGGDVEAGVGDEDEDGLDEEFDKPKKPAGAVDRSDPDAAGNVKEKVEDFVMQRIRRLLLAPILLGLLLVIMWINDFRDFLWWFCIMVWLLFTTYNLSKYFMFAYRLLAVFTVFLVCVVIAYMNAWWFNEWLSQFWNTHAWTEENIVRYMIRWTNSRAAVSYANSKAFHEAMAPEMEMAARDFQLHWVFAESTATLSAWWWSNPSWYDMIENRLKTLGRLFAEQGRDDFKIEKDKCALIQFFRNNKLPAPRTFGPWRGDGARSAFKAELAGKLQKYEPDPWKDKPGAFVKCCHLTIGGGQSSVTRIASRTDAIESTKTPESRVSKWLDKFWEHKADDTARPWRLANNFLTDNAHLEKGVVMQSSVGRMFELKIEVIWGKAYVASAADPGTYDGSDSEAVVRRWPNGTWDIEVFPEAEKPWNQIQHAGIPLQECNEASNCYFHNKWILEEENGAYMQCAWDLAEAAATLMGIDEVRMDVFMLYGDPHNCKANENSISSGVPYSSNFPFLADVWYQGHKNNWYNRYDNPVKVYEQTIEDIPFLDKIRDDVLFKWQTDYGR